jgi:hypothetical protein
MHSSLASVAILSVLIAAFAPSAASANDLTVTTSGGTLKIKGDADPNVLTLNQSGLNPDQVRVVTAGTTINRTAGPIVFDGVTKGVVIDLGNGDDQLTIDTTTLVGGGSKIKTGPGSDTVFLLRDHLGATTIDLGAGDDAIAICDGSTTKLAIGVAAGEGATRTIGCPGFGTTAAGNAIVLASVGVTDTMKIKGSKATESVAIFGGINQKKATLVLGGGSDSLAMCVAQFNDALGVQMGAGTGQVDATCGGAVVSGVNALDFEGILVLGKFALKMGASSDAALLKNDVFAAPAKLDLGQGGNTLTVEGSTFTGFAAKSAKGDDVVQFTSDASGDVVINGGAGDNTVTFGASQIGGDLTVKTGAGDDTIDTTNAAVGGTRTVASGKGADTVAP